MTSPRPWIGVDLDGTLADYDGFTNPEDIGNPIPAMVNRVKKWLAEDKYDIKIFTARVSTNGTDKRYREAMLARCAIIAWCKEHLGRELEVTNAKDLATVELWDDRAVQVETNTGRVRCL